MQGNLHVRFGGRLLIILCDRSWEPILLVVICIFFLSGIFKYNINVSDNSNIIYGGLGDYREGRIFIGRDGYNGGIIDIVWYKDIGNIICICMGESYISEV